MKLLKIGSSQSCDIVLNSQYVSSLHAEMTILDDGKIILEDKNSKNGTVVGNKKIEPGQEVTIQRGDRVNFADEALVWARVPAAEKLTAYKAVYNIGSNFRNEIILNSPAVSRFHASLRIGKDGKAYIRDNGSRNGTMVNGIKIAPNKDVRIKKGDNILCGTEDITDQIAPQIPGNGSGKIIGIVAACIVALAAIGGLGYYLWQQQMKPKFDTKDARTAVVYVYANYHYVIKFEDNPMPDTWNGNLSDIEASKPYQATAFFLDYKGYMGTNRHVAVPWDYRTAEEDSRIRREIVNRLELAKNTWYYLATYEEEYANRAGGLEKMRAFAQTSLYKAISDHLSNIPGPNQINELLDVIKHLEKSDYDISGEIDEITVGYAGKYYTHWDEFQRCNVISESKDKNIDVALLQLNNKQTPDYVKYVFNPSDFVTDKIVPLEDNLCVIGYPAGLSWNRDDKNKSLEPSIRDTKCSKEPSKYDFEFQETSVGGSSGSPVFIKEDGRLVGILWGGIQMAGASTQATHAKFLKKLYEEEVGQWTGGDQ